MDITKSDRIVNGYRVIYKPDHPKAMTSYNWKGYVYEHIQVAEDMLGRPILKNEVVHHLNGNRLDNRVRNLLVLINSQHTKLHAWLSKGAPGIEKFGLNRVNSGKSKVEEPPKICKVCNRQLQTSQSIYCSNKCRSFDRRVATRPSKEELKSDLESNSMLALGKKYGVSDNSIRKWARSYGLL